jgi:hypothetical protein
MANQADALVDKGVTELVRTCATAEHDKLETLEDLQTLSGLSEEFQC